MFALHIITDVFYFYSILLFVASQSIWTSEYCLLLLVSIYAIKCLFSKWTDACSWVVVGNFTIFMYVCLRYWRSDNQWLFWYCRNTVQWYNFFFAKLSTLVHQGTSVSAEIFRMGSLFFQGLVSMHFCFLTLPLFFT